MHSDQARLTSVLMDSASEHVDGQPTLEAEAAPVVESHPGLENGANEPALKDAPPKKLDVTMKDPVLVYPRGATPHRRLYLSPLDRLPPLLIYSLYFYKKVEAKDSSDVFNEIKAALEKNLVAYYPAAGRIVNNAESGEPELHCYAQGALLVEASTDARIEDFGDMRDSNQDFEKFIFKVGSDPDTPLVVSQVTRCGCGGFVIGFGSRHELFDGLSSLHFLSDWASLARGEPQETISSPSHKRELLKPKPVSVPGGELEELYSERFQGIPLLGMKELARLHASPQKHIIKAFSISQGMIKSLKEKALKGRHISTCTTFEVVAAHVWLARIKALELKPVERALLEFPVNTRPKVVPPLPRKLFANAFIIAHCNRSVEELLSAPFYSVVKLVQDAKAQVTDSFIWKSIEAKNSTKLTGLPSFRETTIVTDWTKFSLHQLDFGWGPAAFATPIAMILSDVLFLLRDGLDKGGICLKLGLLPEFKDAFERHLYDV